NTLLNQFLSTYGSSFIGIDDLLANVGTNNGGYPPYDLEKVGDNTYKLIFALAGFTKDEITILQEKEQLVISGKIEKEEKDNSTYLHKGIARRSFKRTFKLEQY